MLFRKIRFIVFPVIIALFSVLIMLKFFGTAVLVSASGHDRIQQAEPMRLPPIIIVTTDNNDYLGPILDLAGEKLGDGRYFGKVKCNGDNCNQKTTVILNKIEYEYKFSSRLVLDPDVRRLVVNGTGIVIPNTDSTIPKQKDRFSFTATFLDNRDGTFWTRYEASRHDASFIIPDTPGRFEIGGE